jgi:2-dehydropantoate 2-reductase
MANVLVYGSGAIGSLVGYLLSEIDEHECSSIENVGLLGRAGHIQRVREHGLKISFFEGQRTLRFKHCLSSLAELDRSDFFPDIVVVCVKTHTLPEVYREIAESGMLDGRFKGSIFILLMNGMGNREMFDISSAEVFEGVTSNGVRFSEDGLIEIKGIAKTVFEDGMPDEAKQFLKDRFLEKGFEIEFSHDFKTQQWNKLIANAVINPITALTREKNGIVLSGHLEGTVKRIVGECVDVAVKEGLFLDEGDALKSVYSVAEKTSMNTSSMLQDVLKGRGTEIDSINGYVVRLAKRHGISAPVNETLHALVKSLENNVPRSDI